MSIRYIDLAKISEQNNCQFESVEVKPGVIIRQTHWTPKNYHDAKTIIQDEMLLNPDVPISIYNSPDPWVTVALVRELGITYTYPFPGHPEEKTLDLSPLPIGIPEYNYDVQYEIREEGNRIFINMTSDNPDLPRGDGTPHTFQLGNITKVHVPEVTPGKDIYLHAWGMYGVMCCVAATLAENANSVFLACHDTNYYCCSTKGGDHHIGCQAPRLWENSLPHC